MYLEDQIIGITNPQEFTRLCNTIFTSIFGENFQIIDGTRGDEGNDGYVRSDKRVFAIYCPMKPEKKTDSDFYEKIKSDMQKAAILKGTGKLEIERWTFVTPRKLSNDLITKMLQLGKEHGFIVNHIESTFLANELYKNRHLIKAFPQIHIVDIESKFDEILKQVKQEQGQSIKGESHPNVKESIELTLEDSDDYKRVNKLRLSQPTDNTKKELKIIYYKTQDPLAQLNALIGLVDLFHSPEDEFLDMIELCESGASLAESIANNRFNAYFLAKKASFLSLMYGDEDLEMAYSIKISNKMSFPIVSEAQRQGTLSRLRHMQEEYEEAFDKALKIVTKTNDFVMMANVLVMIGVAAGQRGLTYNNMGMKERVRHEKNLCKKSLLLAKNIYVKIGDEEGVASVLHNLSNQIRFFDEKDEALALVRECIEITKKIDNKAMLQKATLLEERIISGVIPDYMSDEKNNPNI